MKLWNFSMIFKTGNSRLIMLKWKIVVYFHFHYINTKKDFEDLIHISSLSTFWFYLDCTILSFLKLQNFRINSTRNLNPRIMLLTKNQMAHFLKNSWLTPECFLIDLKSENSWSTSKWHIFWRSLILAQSAQSAQFYFLIFDLT